jgi:hypothetical protein
MGHNINYVITAKFGIALLKSSGASLSTGQAWYELPGTDHLRSAPPRNYIHRLATISCTNEGSSVKTI